MLILMWYVNKSNKYKMCQERKGSSLPGLWFQFCLTCSSVLRRTLSQKGGWPRLFGGCMKVLLILCLGLVHTRTASVKHWHHQSCSRLPCQLPFASQAARSCRHQLCLKSLPPFILMTLQTRQMRQLCGSLLFTWKGISGPLAWWEAPPSSHRGMGLFFWKWEGWFGPGL